MTSYVLICCLSNFTDINGIFFGLSQSGRCTDTSDAYHINNEQYIFSSINNPIIYDQSYSCIDDIHMNNCYSLRVDPMFQLTDIQFSKYFKLPTTRPYLSLWFLLLFILYYCIDSIILVDATTARTSARRLAVT